MEKYLFIHGETLNENKCDEKTLTSFFLIKPNDNNKLSKFENVTIHGFKKQPIFRDCSYSEKVFWPSDKNVLEDVITVFSLGNICEWQNNKSKENITLSNIISTIAFLENSIGIYENEGDECDDRKDHCVEDKEEKEDNFILICFENTKMSSIDFKLKYLKLNAKDKWCKWKNSY